MARITSVRTSVREDRTLVIFRCEGSETPIFLTGSQVAAATGIVGAFHTLRGGDLEVTYYKVDEEMISGQKCTKDNTIIKDFEVEMPQRLSQFQEMAVVGLKVSLT